MSKKTKIAWCDSTWNPVIGCDRVSEGCGRCYIEKAPPLRIRGMKLGSPPAELSEHNWNEPFRWNRRPWICESCGRADDRHYDHSCTGRKEDACHTANVKWHRRRVFAPSLSDWLHPGWKVEWRIKFLNTIRECQNIDFLLCTKRPEFCLHTLNGVYRELHSHGGYIAQVIRKWIKAWLDGSPPPNVWILVTAEDQKRADERIPHLLKIPAHVHGLSCEPLLGSINLRFPFPSRMYGLDWVIVGGESGKNARPCGVGWVRHIKDQCEAAGVPCFVKQLGSNPLAQFQRFSLKHPKGGDPSEWPEDLCAQQWPKVER